MNILIFLEVYFPAYHVSDITIVVISFSEAASFMPFNCYRSASTIESFQRENFW